MKCLACGMDSQRDLGLDGRPRRGAIKQRLRELLKVAGARGQTVDELEQATGIGHQSVSARVHELFNGGEVVRRGSRVARSGKRAGVYVWPPPSRCEFRNSVDVRCTLPLHGAEVEHEWMGLSLTSAVGNAIATTLHAVAEVAP